jgi:hypothetical protein
VGEPGGDAVEALGGGLDATLHGAREAGVQQGQLVVELDEAGAGQLGGGGGGGGAQVGGEVGDAHVGLVADAHHHRQRAGADGAGDGFAVEGGEVFEAAAAAHQEQHIGAVTGGAAASPPDGRGDLGRRAVALHWRGVEGDRHVGRPAGERRGDVAPGGGLGRADHRDAARKTRQCPLGGRLEEPSASRRALRRRKAS